MRISDWSSDVCSADLLRCRGDLPDRGPLHSDVWRNGRVRRSAAGTLVPRSASLPRLRRPVRGSSLGNCEKCCRSCEARCSGGVEVTDFPGLDLAALHKYLQAAGVAVSGALRAALISGGKSNLTYGIFDDNSKRSEEHKS